MKKRVLAVLLTAVFLLVVIGAAAAEDGGAVLTQEAFKAHSLVLSDSIGVKFFMDLSLLEDAERDASHMTFDISGKGKVSGDPVPFNAEETNVTGEYYSFICHVNAVQMADTITATYHYGDDQTISETFSILQYIETFDRNQSQFDETTVALVKALADYGHHTHGEAPERRRGVAKGRALTSGAGGQEYGIRS